MSTSLEKSLLEDYRSLILYPNNVNAPIQHPQYSFYYAEFCRLDGQMYNKRGLESKEEREFDLKARNYFLEAEANRITKVSNLISQSLCKNDADVGKLIGALVIMEIYVKNLILMPWKEEFHTILTYSGIYKIWIEPHLVGADQMFNQFGYKPTENGERYVLSQQHSKVTLEQTAMRFRLASLMCFLVYFEKKHVLESSLGLALKVSKMAPIGENDIIPTIKKQLLSRHKTVAGDSSVAAEPKISEPGPRSGETPLASPGKRDKEIQCNPIVGEVEAMENVSLRNKSLDLKNFIVTTHHKQDDKANKGARPKEFECTFKEAGRPTHYGFSQPFSKGLSMCLSPGFDPIVDEDEDEDEFIRSASSNPCKNPSKEGRNARQMTFSTFKKQSPSGLPGLAGLKDVIPSIHHYQVQTARHAEEDEDEGFLERFP